MANSSSQNASDREEEEDDKLSSFFGIVQYEEDLMPVVAKPESHNASTSL